MEACGAYTGDLSMCVFLKVPKLGRTLTKFFYVLIQYPHGRVGQSRATTMNDRLLLCVNLLYSVRRRLSRKMPEFKSECLFYFQQTFHNNNCHQRYKKNTLIRLV